MKKITLIILAFLLVLISSVYTTYYFINKHQIEKFTNFTDPKFTNEELSVINSKILELESLISSSNIENNKTDLYKLEMELSSQYKLRGRLLDSKNTLLQASKLLPENSTPWGELYNVENLRGDYDSASKSIQKAIELNPSNSQYWRWYIELKQGPLKTEESELLDIYSQAVDKTSGNIDIITIYASYLEKQNDLVGAVAQWKRAIEKNPAGATQYQAEIARIQNKLK